MFGCLGWVLILATLVWYWTGTICAFICTSYLWERQLISFRGGNGFKFQGLHFFSLVLVQNLFQNWELVPSQSPLWKFFRAGICSIDWEEVHYLSWISDKKVSLQYIYFFFQRDEGCINLLKREKCRKYFKLGRAEFSYFLVFFFCSSTRHYTNPRVEKWSHLLTIPRCNKEEWTVNAVDRDTLKNSCILRFRDLGCFSLVVRKVHSDIHKGMTI